MDCIFCNIISGKFDSAKVYEDADVLAFLDVYPVTKGHCLVIPKKHCQDIFDIPESDLQKVMASGKQISQKIKDVLKADGIRLSQSNGRAAGQDVMHFHLHVIPRYEDDGVLMHGASVAHPQKADFEELKKLAETVKFG